MRRFNGSIVALVTPFKNGEIDWQNLDHLIHWHLEEGSHGLVPCGTTGEASTLSDKEHIEIIRRTAEIVAGRVPVIAGTGSNNTSHAIELTKAAQEAGADACLTVAPYYNKPSQEGLYFHFETIHHHSKIPLILYNIPGRSAVDMSNDTIARLSRLPRVAGLKDASNDLSRPLWMRLHCPEDFCLLSGDDASVGAYLAQGGDGCISVTANIAPALCVQLHKAWQAGDLEAFGKCRDRLYPLHSALFFESSPAPVKYALSRMSGCRDELRQPLLSASEACRRAVDAAVADVFGTYPTTHQQI